MAVDHKPGGRHEHESDSPIEMLIRVRGFGEAYGSLFPERTHAAQAFAAVAAAIERVKASCVRQMSAAVSARAQRKDVERQVLLRRLSNLRATARCWPKGARPQGQKLELPGRGATDQALLVTARRFLSAASPLQARFIAHGMPLTFLTDLRRLVGRFERALRHRNGGRDEQLAAQLAIAGAIAGGLAAVRTLQALDVIVANHLEEDEGDARRVGARPRVIYASRRLQVAAEPVLVEGWPLSSRSRSGRDGQRAVQLGNGNRF